MLYNYDMDEIIQQVTQLTRRISALPNSEARLDLFKMLKVVDRRLTALSREGVECNRLHRTTPRYVEIVNECNAMLKNLDQHLIYAQLKYG
jgi:hypothetical protein